jgi:hypothetical protein
MVLKKVKYEFLKMMWSKRSSENFGRFDVFDYDDSQRTWLSI